MSLVALPSRKSPGDAITADDYNLLVDAIRRVILTPGQSPGFDMDQSPGGTSIQIVARDDRVLAKVTSGGISARSGSTPGSGNVTLQNYDPTNKIADSGIEVPILNYSSATGGFSSGAYCWIEQDCNGYWWVVSAECSS